MALSPIIIYADGSCRGNPGPMGIGYCLLVANQDGSIGRYSEDSSSEGHGTNQQAELLAIIRALEALNPSTKREIEVHTDSQYVIGVLAKQWKARANLDLVIRARQLVKSFQGGVVFHKSIGHSGDRYNEKANALAQEASLS